VTDAEVTDYVALFNQGTSMLQLSPADALAGTLAALMQSPNTLYIQELGQAAQSGFSSRGYELASIWLTGSPARRPARRYSTAWARVRSTRLPASRPQRRRSSPARKGKAHMSTFFLQWLSYDGAPYAAKDPAVYTLPNPVATRWLVKTKQFVDSTYQSGGSLTDLLTSSNTYVNLSLAKFYGWPTAGTYRHRIQAAAATGGARLGPASARWLACTAGHAEQRVAHPARPVRLAPAHLR